MSVVMTFQNFTTSAYAAAINVHPCVVSHDYSGAPSCAYLGIYVYFICVIHMCHFMCVPSDPSTPSLCA